MGIAAYSRGSEAIARQIHGDADDWKARHHAEIIERLNSYPKGTVIPFAPGVIRLDKARNGWWLMNREEDGFASHGYFYPLIKDLIAAWSIDITGFGSDKCSMFYRFVPYRKES